MTLLCAGPTRSGRTGAFGAADKPLDEAGRRRAAACRIPKRFRGHVLTSPARAAVETVKAMDLEARAEHALADIDHGAWAGRLFEEIHAEAPDTFAAWLADPVGGAPGGESMTSVLTRVASWLDSLSANDTPLCAITHPMTIRCALAHALGLPLRSTLAIDIAPLAQVQLSFNAIWRLQAIEPAG